MIHIPDIPESIAVRGGIGTCGHPRPSPTSERPLITTDTILPLNQDPHLAVLRANDFQGARRKGMNKEKKEHRVEV